MIYVRNHDKPRKFGATNPHLKYFEPNRKTNRKIILLSKIVYKLINITMHRKKILTKLKRVVTRLHRAYQTAIPGSRKILCTGLKSVAYLFSGFMVWLEKSAIAILKNRKTWFGLPSDLTRKKCPPLNYDILNTSLVEIKGAIVPRGFETDSSFKNKTHIWRQRCANSSVSSQC